MKKFICAAACLLLVAGCALKEGPSTSAGDAIKRDAKGMNAMVAAAKPEASEVGVKILKQGGNAIDAAVATAFALGAVEPNASGMGGGGFMLIRFAKTGEVVFIDYRETAPKKAKADMYKLNKKGKVINNASKVGGLAVAVPGNVAGLLTALEKYGTMSRQQVLKPAIDYARNGLRVSKVLQGMIEKNFDKLGKYPASRKIFFKGDLPLEAGDTLVNEDLAKALEIVAKKGKDGFYKGEIAKRLVEAVQSSGGIITLEDLAEYKVKLRKPVKGTYRGYEIISSPPASSGGTHVVELLNIMENFDMKKLPYGSVDYWHAWSEAMKLMYADRAAYLGDADFVKVPIQGLTSKKYAKTLFAKIDMAKAVKKGQAGDPWPYNDSGNTSHISIVDKQGNMVALTQTINYFFGSGVTVPGCGFILNDEMHDFAKKPGSKNSIAPGKRPLSSMSPTLLLKDGQPYATLGSPGGMRIITTVSQIISNLIDQGMDVQQAIEAPKTNNYQKGPYKIESRISKEVQAGLQKKGHKIKVYKPFDLYFGGAQAVVRNLKTGELHGGADPRRDGVARGY
jgi:gamma-glutamyltranspeptidase/glutathione hydrolase